MADATPDTWSLLAGIGFLIGGLLQSVGTMIGMAGSAGIGFPISWIGVVVLGVTLVAMALGRTGRSGVVGASKLGRIAVILSGFLFVLLTAILVLTQLGAQIPVLAYIVVSIAGVFGFALAAIVIQRTKVAVGVARWILLVPSLWGILGLFTLQGSPAIPTFEGILNMLAGAVFLVGAVRNRSLSAAEPEPSGR